MKMFWQNLITALDLPVNAAEVKGSILCSKTRQRVLLTPKNDKLNHAVMLQIIRESVIHFIRQVRVLLSLSYECKRKKYACEAQRRR